MVTIVVVGVLLGGLDFCILCFDGVGSCELSCPMSPIQSSSQKLTIMYCRFRVDGRRHYIQGIRDVV